jgi:N-acetylglucosamine-6-phosphate deacetylase
MASANPSRVLNRQQEIGSLIPGRRADLVVFDGDFSIRATFINGVQSAGNLRPA